MYKRYVWLLALIMIVGMVPLAHAESDDPANWPTVHVLMVAQNADAQDMNERPFVQEICKRAKVNVEWEIVRSGWSERKNLVLAGGESELPDMFFNALTAADVLNNIEFFEPLQDLVAAYAPNVQFMFDDDPALRKASTFPDGNVYTLANRQPARPDSIGTFYINQAWLTKLGLAMPTTLDEFREVLQHFLTDDPNGNGIQDEIPLAAVEITGLISGFALDQLLGSFGAQHSILSYLRVDDGMVSYVPALDGWQQWASYLHTLYEDGTLDKEIATGSWDLLGVRSQSEIPIMGVVPLWSCGFAYKDEYVAMPPLTGPDGDSFWPANPAAYNKNTFNLIQITKKAENKDAIMRLLNEFYDPEMGVQAYFGSYGVGCELNDDGTFTLLDSQDPNIRTSTMNMIYGLENVAPVYITEEVESRIRLSADLQARLDCDAVYADHFDFDMLYPYMVLTKDETDEASIIETDIQRLMQEKLTEWVLEGGVEDEWDEYLDNMQRMGLDRYLEIYQGAYDRYISY